MDSSQVTLSVVTPSYCQGDFIERTIESVLSQNLDLEFYVCDGGSTDKTVSILESYGPLIHWVSEPDAGQADAINKAIQRTSGEIVAWINSDDIYYPGTLKLVKSVFESNPDIQILYGQADWIDATDQIIDGFPTQLWNYGNLKNDCYICQPAVFFRRVLIDRYGNLDAALHYCMDYELWLRYGKHVAFHHIPKKLAGSRMYPSNKTMGSRLSAHQEINQMIKEKFGYVPESWMIGLSLVKTEELSNIDKLDNDKSRAFLLILIRYLLMEYSQRKQIPSLRVLAKVVFWLLFPHLVWFKRSNNLECN